LELLINHVAEQPEETDKIALASAIRADQHIDMVELEGFQFADGFEPLDRDVIYDLAH
jgi:hypothetical protein